MYKQKALQKKPDNSRIYYVGEGDFVANFGVNNTQI